MTNLMDDCLVYGTGAAASMLIEHLLAGGVPKAIHGQPQVAKFILERYTLGSATVLATCAAYALRRPAATGRDLVALHIAVLTMSGGVVAASYWVREQIERHAADVLRRKYIEEEHGRRQAPVSDSLGT